MNQNQNQSQQTGTRNETYDLISVLYHALQGAENCQTYAQDSKDDKAREFFKHALQVQRELADKGKQVLQQCLQKDTGDQSAFGWGQKSGQSGNSGQTSGQSSSSGESQSMNTQQGTSQRTPA